jgi:hypothetical protein
MAVMVAWAVMAAMVVTTNIQSSILKVGYCPPSMTIAEPLLIFLARCV